VALALLQELAPVILDITDLHATKVINIFNSTWVRCKGRLFKPNVHNSVSTERVPLLKLVHANQVMLDPTATKVLLRLIETILYKSIRRSCHLAYCEQTCVHGTCTSPGNCTGNIGYGGITCKEGEYVITI